MDGSGEKSRSGLKCCVVEVSQQETFEVLVIPADPSTPCRIEQITGGDGALAKMQTLVRGYIEAVSVDTGRLTDPTLPPMVYAGRRATLYVNEEFRFLDVPPNPRASRLYPWNEGIFGDAFLAGPPSAEGYDTSVPEDAAQFYLNPSNEGE